jgi:ATP-binding cassette subfamily B (MDR/TAP) protein 8
LHPHPPPATGEALERERFQSEVVASFAAGRQFGSAKASFEATNRLAIHLSLLMLYAWGGWLVSNGMMPVGVLVSGIGFTFSLMYATQGAVNTLSELRRASGAFDRVRRIVRCVCVCVRCAPACVARMHACSLACTLFRHRRHVPPPPHHPQVRSLVQGADPDPSMYGALPPGAWWEVANGAEPVVEAYADRAGDAAIVAARSGDLELADVSFAYPLRKDFAGEC